MGRERESGDVMAQLGEKEHNWRINVQSRVVCWFANIFRSCELHAPPIVMLTNADGARDSEASERYMRWCRRSQNGQSSWPVLAALLGVLLALLCFSVQQSKVAAEFGRSQTARNSRRPELSRKSFEEYFNLTAVKQQVPKHEKIESKAAAAGSTLSPSIGCGRNSAGVKRPEFGDDIKYVIPGEFPAYVLLEIKSGSGGILCGGTLIGKDQVITAARCFEEGYQEVRVIHTVDKEYGIHQQKRLAQRVCEPANFEPQSADYNIAIIKLKEPFELDDHIQPACLPEKLLSPEDQAYIVGFAWNEQLNFTDRLQVFPVSKHECQSNESDKVVCFRSGFPKRPDLGNGCPGDSGGPVFSLAGGKLTVHGAMNWRSDSCNDVYTSSNFWTLIADIQTLIKECATSP